MSSESRDAEVRRLIDRAAIEDAIHAYAQGVDRGDWEAVRATYHPDGFDDHGEYKGPVDGLIAWLEDRFAGLDNSMHFIGNCLIDFAGPALALAESYFVSRRFLPPDAGEAHLAGPEDAMCREAWGRYVDRFEKRDGVWRVAHRTVVVETKSTSVARGGRRGAGVTTWGRRDGDDPLHRARRAIFGAR
ncbi:MAG: nuclear transport factor 2 family protein [Sphingomonas bacterium]